MANVLEVQLVDLLSSDRSTVELKARDIPWIVHISGGLIALKGLTRATYMPLKC